METTQQLLALGLAWYVVFLFSLTVHEAAHAWVAHLLRDSTAYEGGQVSLNPWPHMRREMFGTVLIPILSFAYAQWMMGWASAPYDPMWAERYPKRAALMALAGPASNLVLVVLSGLAIRLGMATGHLAAPSSFRQFSEVVVATEIGPWEGVATMLGIAFFLNLLLFVFNLLPLPPLDGSGVLPLLLPENIAERYRAILREPMWSLLGILLAWRIFGSLFEPIKDLALAALYPEFTYS